MDGVNWTEIDRRTNHAWDGDFRIHSFDVSHSVECKFIRLTQTETNLDGNDTLYLRRFDVFGSVWTPDE
jgi:hypothetical protein